MICCSDFYINSLVTEVEVYKSVFCECTKNSDLLIVINGQSMVYS